MLFYASIGFYFDKSVEKYKRDQLGEGSDNHHMRIIMTSIAMMTQFEYKGVLYIDGA
jgi:hypothetical protein